MSRLPIYAFVFKGFMPSAALLLTASALICLPDNLAGAEEPALSQSTERAFDSTKQASEMPETPSDDSIPAKVMEPTRAHEHEPYQFPLDEENLTKEAPEDHFFGQFMKMLGTLGLLIAIMVAASWSLKRMLNTRVQQLNESSLIKVVETRALSNKSSLHLVEIDGKTLVIGEAVNSITLLTSLEKDDKDV